MDPVVGSNLDPLDRRHRLVVRAVVFLPWVALEAMGPPNSGPFPWRDGERFPVVAHDVREGGLAAFLYVG